MNKNGFSLVELIIVIAIMAVLIGVLAPQYLKYVNNAKVSTDMDSCDAIKTATEALIADGKLTSTTSTSFSITSKVTPTSGDAKTVIDSVGKDFISKYDPTGGVVTVTYDSASGVTKVEFTTNSVAYEVYPNPEDATKGMNAKLKR